MLVPGLDFVRVDTSHAGPIYAAFLASFDDGPSVVLSLENIGPPSIAHTPAGLPDSGGANVDSPAYAGKERTAALPVADGCAGIRPGLVAAFQSVLKQIADRRLERVRQYAVLAQTAIVGTASTYNPYRDGNDAEYFETSSGELYDPSEWTAAIQIDLRNYFGGVRYGRNYRPAYVLVESTGKQAIVKINDVGPLKPGRAIDLNERSMRYFDPSLQLGLLYDMKITLLPGDDWVPGPVGDEQPVNIASAQ